VQAQLGTASTLGSSKLMVTMVNSCVAAGCNRA